MYLNTIQKLYQLTRRDIQESWFLATEDGKALEPATLNENRSIVWPKGRQIQYLTRKITIPNALAGYPLEGMELRLILAWWAEDAKIYVNGELVREGDLFDSSTRILLSSSVIPGQEITVTLRLVSPNHDIGGLMKSELVYERSQGIDPGFVADELTILHNYLQAFSPEKLETFTELLQSIDWENITEADKFDRSLQSLRESLQPLAEPIKKRTFHLLGHAHLDMAWLWPLAETWDVARRTFQSVLTLQKDYPELVFGHSSPILYDWIEKNRSELFNEILEANKARSWELLGGMWVEPEVNLISGESLLRQLFYGQRYFQEKFGRICRVAWLPDTFGFPYQLPQILHHCGIEYFVTGKLHWNDSTKFSHGFFWWQSPDGTRVPSLMSPPNVAGVMDTNPIIMTDHAVNWERQTGLQDIFWLPGVGDHGGGPTRDMLEVARRWQSSPFFPNIRFTTAENYLDSLDRSALPVWDDELYLEFHRGCYTTHADQKFYNRYCESLLYQAELWSSLATIRLQTPYPKAEIEESWKKVLLNQFHDILPGTSIPEVFTDANETWREAIESGENILHSALQTIVTNISLPTPPRPDAKPIVIFNSLNWTRSNLVSLDVESGYESIYDLAGEKCLSGISRDGKLLFIAENIPSIGYRLFWLTREAGSGGQEEIETVASEFVLENPSLKVLINPETGDIDSIFDKVHQKEILSGAGNQLQAFRDGGQYWDAWNIDPNYQQYPLSPIELQSIETLEFGPVRWRVRVVRIFRDSEFCQDYILENHSPILRIETKVNWQETHTVIKASFPLTVRNDFTTYEIACGAIERTNTPETPEEKAKWEVYGHKWADITDKTENYGVSLLNNGKYGHDSQPNQLRLTLLRGSLWPDPNADRGIHQFTYAIYPHAGDWQTAQTVHRAYELNIPSLAIPVSPSPSPNLPPSGKWLHFPDDNVIVMALKQSEDNPESWILRAYECHGKTAEISLESEIGLKLENSIDGLERPTEPVREITPWKIATWRLSRPCT
ncbi:alpha-mannosidase [Pannus brasiliensis]